MPPISTNDISVVIPCFKANKTILRTISSTLKSGFKESQIVVIDDCSNDGIINQIIKRYKHIKYIINKKNLGAAYCRNIGIKNFNKKYILFIDSDIYFKKSNLIKLIQKRSKNDIIFPKIIYDDGSIMSPNNSYEEKNCMCSAMFVAKRKALKSLDELFDKNYLIYGEDSDFFLRCKAFGLKFEYIKNATIQHPKKYSYSEKIFYLQTRNAIYFSLKIGGIIKYKSPILKYLIGFTFYNFTTALLNRNIQLNPLKIQSHVKYSNRPFPRIRLLYYFFSAISWNIKNIPMIIKKRNKLKTRLRKRGSLIDL